MMNLPRLPRLALLCTPLCLVLLGCGQMVEDGLHAAGEKVSEKATEVILVQVSSAVDRSVRSYAEEHGVKPSRLKASTLNTITKGVDGLDTLHGIVKTKAGAIQLRVGDQYSCIRLSDDPAAASAITPTKC